MLENMYLHKCSNCNETTIVSFKLKECPKCSTKFSDNFEQGSVEWHRDFNEDDKEIATELEGCYCDCQFIASTGSIANKNYEGFFYVENEYEGSCYPVLIKASPDNDYANYRILTFIVYRNDSDTCGMVDDFITIENKGAC